MNIKLITGDEINFQNSFLKDNFEGRKSNTSYLNEFKVNGEKVKFNSDFLYRLICYNNLRESLKGNYSTNLDIFGGVGITAKLFSTSNSKTYVNDIDEQCLDILYQNFENVYNQDSFNFKSSITYDLILADFNDFTIRKFKDNRYDEALKNLLNHSNKYLIINDCSIFYLKYGKSSYENYSKLLGVNIANFEEFLQALTLFYENNLKGWKVREIQYFHNSSFILFEKSEIVKSLKLNRVANNNQQIITCQI